jgi:hypothetical protein
MQDGSLLGYFYKHMATQLYARIHIQAETPASYYPLFPKTNKSVV